MKLSYSLKISRNFYINQRKKKEKISTTVIMKKLD
jgi:hypothetical protein